MQQLRIALLALAAACGTGAAAAQTSPADYLRAAEAVDRALGPNAELMPPAPNGLAAPAPPPDWFWRQPFAQQPFFATRPGACFRPVPGGGVVPC